MTTRVRSFMLYTYRSRPSMCSMIQQSITTLQYGICA